MPCIGYGYDIYSNIVFEAVTSTAYIISFYGKSAMIELKKFKPSLISEEIGQYLFSSQVIQTDVISYPNYTVSKILVTLSGELFPTVYRMVGECHSINAF
jgi:hypothetical protein